MFKKSLLVCCLAAGMTSLACEHDIAMSETPGLDVLVRAGLEAETEADYISETPRIAGSPGQGQNVALYRCVEGRSQPFECAACDHCFTNFPKCADHVLRRHIKRALFACPECGGKFVSPAVRNTHYKEIHREYISDYPLHHKIVKDDRRIMVSVVGRSVATNRKTASWLEHADRHSTMYKCQFAPDVCAMCFSVKDKLWDHLLRHLGKRQLVCDKCGESFCTTRDCSRHMRKGHGEPLSRKSKKRNRELVAPLITPDMYEVIEQQS